MIDVHGRAIDRWQSSIDILDHDGVEVIEAHLAVPVGVCLLEHELERLFVEILLDLVVDFPEVVEGEVVLVVAVILLEDGCDFLLGFVAVGLGVHGLHELDEADASCLLHVELCHYLISGLPVGIEAVLGKQQFEVIRQKHSHPGGIVGVEDFLEVDDVLVGEGAGEVEFWLKLSEIFAFESDSVLAGAVNAGL